MPATLPDLDQQRTREGVCLTYPADELQHFDPEEAIFHRLPGGVSYVRVPGDFPPLKWTHLAIQVLPDGRAQLFVNRRPVAELRVRLTGTAYDDWRVLLAGHSVDTRLEVRYVTLWRGARY
jgi:hypothetical protein